jgi:hypothetical protein
MGMKAPVAAASGDYIQRPRRNGNGEGEKKEMEKPPAKKEEEK